jgi:hypothetical protein
MELDRRTRPFILLVLRAYQERKRRWSIDREAGGAGEGIRTLEPLRTGS